MAFNSKNTIIANNLIPNTPDNTPASSNNLELQELEFLLKVLANADLKGNQVELFYNLILKLQNQYLQKQPNK